MAQRTNYLTGASFITFLERSISYFFRISTPLFLFTALIILFQSHFVITSVQAQTIHYFYDTGPNAIGRISSVSEETGVTVTGTTEFEYDQRGNIKRLTKTIDGNSNPSVFDYTYDSLDRLLDLTYPDSPSRETIRYSYNSQGLLERIRSVTYSTDYISNFDYNALDQVKLKKFGNGVETSYSYHNLSFRLQNIKTTNGATSPTTLQDFVYEEYDEVGNLKKIVDNAGPADQTFGYDDLHRLTSASSDQSPAYLHSYAYDSIGNMTSGAGKTFTRPPVGFPQPHAPRGDGIYTYDYDANGNLISKVKPGVTRSFFWNVANQLTRIEENGTVLASFSYDYTGYRVKKLVGSVATTYVGDLYECSPNSCSKHIFAGPERVALRPIGSSNEVFYFHPDHLGSTSLVTNNQIGSVQKLVYFPYGQTRDNLIPPQQDFQYKYTGQELDVDTGLYYYGARYYDPDLMRFISADPITLDQASPQMLNRYSYVLNNPLKFIDPSGNIPTCRASQDFTVDCESASLQFATEAWNNTMAAYNAGEYGVAQLSLASCSFCTVSLI